MTVLELLPSPEEVEKILDQAEAEHHVESTLDGVLDFQDAVLMELPWGGVWMSSKAS